MSTEVSHEDEREAILEIEKETFEAIRNKDRAALERILADDFLYRSPGAEDVNKIEFIKIASALPVRIKEVWGEGLQANIYGEVAVLTGLQHARVETEDSEEVISSVAFTDIFVKSEGEWKMALAYGVEYKEVSESSSKQY
jgi:ketosteroid isomerase-like protein